MTKGHFGFSLRFARQVPRCAPAMPSPLSDAFNFIRTNDLKTILAKFNDRDAHPAIQFAKYTISGGVATVIFSSCFLYFSHLFPSTQQGGWLSPLPCVLGAFMFSNAAVYWLNTRWVFTPGRHSVLLEFLYFTLVNMPGAVGGYFVLAWMGQHGYSLVEKLGGFLVPNILINYICRKFFIFKK